MTVSKHRIDRGTETNHLLTGWFQRQGWQYAETVGSGRGGTDITGMPGLLAESKAWANWQPTTWLRQHEQPPLYDDRAALLREPAPLTFIVQRPNGYGAAKLPEWPAILRLDTLTWMLHGLGFGSPR